MHLAYISCFHEGMGRVGLQAGMTNDGVDSGTYGGDEGDVDDGTAPRLAGTAPKVAVTDTTEVNPLEY